MTTPAEAQAVIDADIKANGTGAITGTILNTVLTTMNAALETTISGLVTLSGNNTWTGNNTWSSAGTNYFDSTGLDDGKGLSALNPTFTDVNVTHPTRPFYYMAATTLGSNLKASAGPYIQDGDTTGTIRFAMLDDAGAVYNDWLTVARTGDVPQVAQLFTALRVNTELDIFGLFTNNANYEGLNIEWNSSNTYYQIATVKAGTGVSRDIYISRDSGASMYLSSINITFGVGVNTFTLTPGASNLATFQGGVAGTTVSGTGAFTSLSGTAIPAGGTAGSGYKFSSTTNFGVFFGSSTPTLAAAKGSLYLRSDGSTTNDRAYINTNGSTTWTALTTAA